MERLLTYENFEIEDNKNNSSGKKEKKSHSCAKIIILLILIVIFEIIYLISVKFRIDRSIYNKVFSNRRH